MKDYVDKLLLIRIRHNESIRILNQQLLHQLPQVQRFLIENGVWKGIEDETTSGSASSWTKCFGSGREKRLTVTRTTSFRYTAEVYAIFAES